TVCAGHTGMTCAPLAAVASGTSEVVFAGDVSLTTAPSVVPKNAYWTSPLSAGAAAHVPPVLRCRAAVAVCVPPLLAVALTTACLPSVASWMVAATMSPGYDIVSVRSSAPNSSEPAASVSTETYELVPSLPGSLTTIHSLPSEPTAPASGG